MKSPNQENLRVAIYIRVSTEEQAEQYGISMQEKSVTGLIKARPENMVLAGKEYVYIDDGISGTTNLNERPAFARLIEDITLAPKDQKPFDVVAVYKIDRFARKLRILLEVIDFFEGHDIKFISAHEMLDTSTAFGKAMLSFIGIIAELERDTLLQRTQDGRVQAIDAGVGFGPNVPYGYEKDEYKRYKILEPEAEIVREIFHLFVNESRSADYISIYLRNKQIPSPKASAYINKKRKGEVGKKTEIYFWFPDGIRRILQDEIYIGNIYSGKTKDKKRVPKEEWVKSKAKAPSIIDILTFGKAQRIFTQTIHQKVVTKDNHSYLLSGLLKCDCCFDKEKDIDGRIRWTGERRELDKGSGRFAHYYKCPRKNRSKSTKWCPAIPLPANKIEKYVVNFSRKLLNNPVAVFNHQENLKSRLNSLKYLKKKEEEIINLSNALPDRKDRIREQHIGGYIDTSKLKKEFKTLEQTEKNYKKELSNIQEQIAQTKISQEYVKSINLFSKKYKNVLEKSFKDRTALYTLLHELIDEIVVFSRDVKESDPKIAGRKKENQKIPHKIHIKFKLPQEILSQLPNISSGQEMITGDPTGNRTPIWSLKSSRPNR
jgi:site-specific DNA recombinase